MGDKMIKNLDVLDGLGQIKSETVDCIILDPPYNIGKDYGNNQTKLQISDYISWSKEWLQECKRILKPDGTIYIYGFSEILAHLSVNTDLEKRWLVWHYTNKTVPSLNFWQRTHESILCCWKDEKKFFRDQVRVPYTENFIKGYKGKNRTRPSTAGRFGKSGSTSYTVNEKGALPRDVISCPSLAGGSGAKERFYYSPSLGKLFTSKEKKSMDVGDFISHPTQKPVKLTETLLDACIEEGKIANVVIPFAGTGSECYVCEKRGYNWMGFEINKDFADMGNILVKEGFPQNNKEKK